MTQTPAGWYPDSDGKLRWWDGTQWTEHVQEPTQPLSPEQQGQYAQQQVQQPGQQQGWGQQPGQQPGQQQGWGQQPAYGVMPGGAPGPQKRGLSTGALAGIGGGVLAVLIIVGLILFFTLRGGDDTKNASDSASPSASATASPSESPTDEPSEEPSATPSQDSGGGGDSHEKAANAPKDASVSDFCKSFDLTGFSDLGSGGDLSDLKALQAKMLPVGTPSNMPADARRGWEWFASVSGPSDVASENTDDIEALGRYYGENCM